MERAAMDQGFGTGLVLQKAVPCQFLRAAARQRLCSHGTHASKPGAVCPALALQHIQGPCSHWDQCDEVRGSTGPQGLVALGAQACGVHVSHALAAWLAASALPQGRAFGASGKARAS